MNDYRSSKSQCFSSLHETDYTYNKLCIRMKFNSCLFSFHSPLFCNIRTKLNTHAHMHARTHTRTHTHTGIFMNVQFYA